MKTQQAICIGGCMNSHRFMTEPTEIFVKFMEQAPRYDYKYAKDADYEYSLQIPKAINYQRLDVKFVRAMYKCGVQLGSSEVLIPKYDMVVFVPVKEYETYKSTLNIVLANFINGNWEKVNE